MDKDGFLGQQIDGVAPDGHSLVVDPEQKMYAAFSAKANLSYFRYWEGDFIKLGTFRWGASSGAEPSGEMVAQLEKSWVDKARKNGSVDSSAAGWRVSRENQHYVGMFDTDHGPVYSYEIKGVSILDTVTSQPGKVFQRVIESQGSLGANKIALFDLDKKGLKREGRELWSVGAIKKLVTTNGLIDEHAKKVQIKTIPRLKYDRTKFTVKAGESVALELKNIDSMPHNIVITKPGKKQQVGETAFKMMNDPNARKKNYVPDDKSDLIAYSDVVEPTGKHTTYFKAPKEKGGYPFICTFPGHWQVMQGVMIIE
ncbi:MAG: azurin [Rubritalea sp.]|jgi:azurin